MKYVLSLLLAATAAAHPVTAHWTPNPEPEITGYRVYRQTSVGYALIATSTVNSADLDLQAGDVICVTAFTPVTESEKSDSLTVEFVTLTLQKTEDMKSWRDVVIKHVPRKPKQFYRIKIETEQ